MRGHTATVASAGVCDSGRETIVACCRVHPEGLKTTGQSRWVYRSKRRQAASTGRATEVLRPTRRG
ncbi:unnamed protein product, partial [Ectocarpus sp. 4 AP-2014]